MKHNLLLTGPGVFAWSYHRQRFGVVFQCVRAFNFRPAFFRLDGGYIGFKLWKFVLKLRGKRA